MRSLLAFLLIISVQVFAQCDDFQHVKKEYSRLSELFKNYKGTMVSVGQMTSGVYFVRRGLKFRQVSLEASRELARIIKTPEFNYLSKQAKEAVFGAIEHYSTMAAEAEYISDLVLIGAKGSLKSLVLGEFITHLIIPPKAGVDPQRREDAVDHIVKNPALLLAVSRESACQYIHDSPDIAKAWDGFKFQLNEAKKIEALMDDETLYGTAEERAFWKEGIKDIGVMMVPFELPQ